VRMAQAKEVRCDWSHQGELTTRYVLCDRLGYALCAALYGLTIK